MCSEPMIFAPLSGNFPLYSSRAAISPGISCSARRISLRPHSASERSATLNAGRASDFFLVSDGRTAVAIIVIVRECLNSDANYQIQILRGVYPDEGGTRED